MNPSVSSISSWNLYFAPKDDKNWPLIKPPKSRDFYRFAPFKSDDVSEGPNWLSNTSLWPLNFLLFFRDNILSQPKEKKSGLLKLTTVIALASTAVVGFTLWHLTETITRIALTIIFSPFILVTISLFRMDVNSKVLAMANEGSIILLRSVVFNVLVIGAGVFAGYEMLANYKSPNMDLLNIIYVASLGLAKKE
jgi:hypothetical protein